MNDEELRTKLKSIATGDQYPPENRKFWTFDFEKLVGFLYSYRIQLLNEIEERGPVSRNLQESEKNYLNNETDWTQLQNDIIYNEVNAQWRAILKEMKEN